MRRRPEIAIVSNIPTPYRIPFFAGVDKALSAHGFALKVIFAAAGYARRRWIVDLKDCGFAYQILGSRPLSWGAVERTSFLYGGLGRAVGGPETALVVCGGFSPATVRMWCRSLVRPRPYAIWSEAIRLERRPESPLRVRQRRALVRRAAGFIASGSRARNYLMELGASPGRIGIALSTVDTSFFRNETERLRRAGAAGPVSLLYIGHLTSGKRVDVLFPILVDVRREHPGAVLDLVGDGPERVALERRAAALGLSSAVRFHGFRQRDELPSFLARASCFLFPSEYDVWGMVLVEAMAAGLPCLSSIQAGATADLIRDGVTGYAVDFDKTEPAARIVSWLLGNRAAADRIGEAAADFIASRVSLEGSAAAFADLAAGFAGHSADAVGREGGA